jgi:hypothetical protein
MVGSARRTLAEPTLRSARSILCVGRSLAAGPARRMRGSSAVATAIDPLASPFADGLRVIATMARHASDVWRSGEHARC